MAVGRFTAMQFLAWHSFPPVFLSVRPPHNILMSGGERDIFLHMTYYSYYLVGICRRSPGFEINVGSLGIESKVGDPY